MGNLRRAVGAASVAAGVAYLAKKDNRQKLKAQLDQIMNKIKKTSNTRKLGKPVDIADAQMVDEGAMTSVQYYNKLQEENQTK